MKNKNKQKTPLVISEHSEVVIKGTHIRDKGVICNDCDRTAVSPGKLSETPCISQNNE